MIHSPYTGSYGGVHVNVDQKLADFIDHSDPKEELVHRSIAVKLEEKPLNNQKSFFLATLDDEALVQSFPAIRWSDHPGPLLIDGHNLFYHLFNSIWPEYGYIDLIEIIKAIQAHCQPIETIFHCCWESLKQHQQFQSNLEDLELIATVVNQPIKQVRSGGKEFKPKTDIDPALIGGIYQQCYTGNNASLTILSGDSDYHLSLQHYQRQNPNRPIRIIAPDGSLSNELLLMGNAPLVETVFVSSMVNIPLILRTIRLRDAVRKAQQRKCDTIARGFAQLAKKRAAQRT